MAEGGHNPLSSLHFPAAQAPGSPLLSPFLMCKLPLLAQQAQWHNTLCWCIPPAKRGQQGQGDLTLHQPQLLTAPGLTSPA